MPISMVLENTILLNVYIKVKEILLYRTQLNSPVAITALVDVIFTYLFFINLYITIMVILHDIQSNYDKNYVEILIHLLLIIVDRIKFN